MKKLDKKTVFISGGLSGIGLACAIAAAKEGANLAIADMKNPVNEHAMAEIVKENSNAIFVECNVADYLNVQVAIETVINTFGGIDVALNNAGIGGHPHKVGEMPEHDWLKVISVNLNGIFNCMKHELAHMAINKKGVIVNMASILGKVGFANSSAYVAAKHGIIGLTETAALEYATEGIRINAICPGFIITPLITKSGMLDNPEIKKHLESMHPMMRLGASDEVAKGFIFLASEDSSFITGTSLVIDGGYLAQ